MDQGGNPWFVAKDVCTILDFSDSAQATRLIEEDEKQTLHNMQGITGSKNGIVTIINESGLLDEDEKNTVVITDGNRGLDGYEKDMLKMRTPGGEQDMLDCRGQDNANQSLWSL